MSARGAGRKGEGVDWGGGLEERVGFEGVGAVLLGFEGRFRGLGIFVRWVRQRRGCEWW